MTYLNEKQIEEIVKVSAAVAVQKALEFMDQEKEKRETDKQNLRLRNTKLLLKRYRSFVKHCDDVDIDIRKLEEADNFLEQMQNSEQSEYLVESIKRSKERTFAMVSFIRKMLAVYKVMSEQSLRAEDARAYKVIYDLYIDDEPMTAEAVSLRHMIDKRTVYRDVEKAVQTLSGLMFGVDSIKLH
jgi:hypothetical protein